MAQSNRTMAFVFPGSAPPKDVPDSVVDEIQNPLMDSTNQASFSRRRAAELQRPEMKTTIATPQPTNLFAPLHPSASQPEDERTMQRDCWLEYDCSNTPFDEETVYKELSKLQGCNAIRRKSKTVWLVQFPSPLLAEKFATYDCFRWATSQDSLNLALPAAIPPEESAPNIWLNPPKFTAVEETEESSESNTAKPSFWKVLLLWLVGMEEHPTRFVTSSP